MMGQRLVGESTYEVLRVSELDIVKMNFWLWGIFHRQVGIQEYLRFHMIHMEVVLCHVETLES